MDSISLVKPGNTWCFQVGRADALLAEFVGYHHVKASRGKNDAATGWKLGFRLWSRASVGV